MSNGRVKVGFIGAGTISQLHELGYHDNETGELYAIADSAPGLAQSRKEQWGAQKAYTDYKDLLADPSVDAVEILLPHHLHLPITLEALSAGKHVSLQKPMAISMDEGRQIAAAAAGSDKIFRVVENYRTYEPYMRAKAMIEAGDIGDLITIRVMMVRGKGKGGIDTPPSAQAWRAPPPSSPERSHECSPPLPPSQRRVVALNRCKKRFELISFSHVTSCNGNACTSGF